MSILGIGPLLAVVGALAALVVVSLEKLTGFALTLASPLRDWGTVLGFALAIIGAFFWLSSAIMVKRAFGSHQLVTAGVFRLSRNPMYAGFIVFIVPGIALILNNLVFVCISLAMFVAFKLRIGREEDFLTREFGAQYDAYRRSVPQLIPLVRI